MSFDNYSEKYQKHLKDLQTADCAFDANPCKKTATTLSELKNKLWEDVDMYTPEFIADRKVQEGISALRSRNRLRHHAEVIRIETAFECGEIDEQARLNSHSLNDTTNPLV